MKIENIIQSRAFQAALNITEHLGPFSQNPKIDKLYRIFRLLGFSPDEATEILNDNADLYEL